MKSLLLLVFCISAFNLYAETIQTEIVSIEQFDSETVIFAGDGQVYRIHSEEDIQKAVRAKELGLEVTIELDATYSATEILEQRSNILNISLTSSATLESVYSSIEMGSTQKNNLANNLMSSYISDFSSDYQLSNLMQVMSSNTKSKSQCYNRAHVWSWELYSRFHNGQRIQTGKMWLFFTRRYIREYDYKWWFHIAPYLTVNGEPKVIDRSYSNGPQNERTWTNMFMGNNAECKQIVRYSDYENNQNSEYCYTIKTSVYYWQPWQIEGLEKNGQVRNQWNSWEVKKAYKNVFGWFARVPSLD